MEIDLADQLERLIALIDSNPWAFIGALLALLLVLGFQKEGLFSRIFAYLEAKAKFEASLEQRRFDIILMLEDRRQRELPGLELKEDEEK
jgi:hypothetical protein